MRHPEPAEKGPQFANLDVADQVAGEPTSPLHDRRAHKGKGNRRGGRRKRFQFFQNKTPHPRRDEVASLQLNEARFSRSRTYAILCWFFGAVGFFSLTLMLLLWIIPLVNASAPEASYALTSNIYGIYAADISLYAASAFCFAVSAAMAGKAFSALFVIRSASIELTREEVISRFFGKP